MKHIVIFSGLFVVLLFASCKKDQGPTDPPPQQQQPESATGTYNSTSGGSFATTSGYGVSVIAGSVPKNDNGQSASVTFSIETGVTAPKPIPSGATQKGEVVKFGPDGFFFQWPVRIKMKYPTGADPTKLSVLYFDALNDKWIAVPSSGANVDQKIVTADVLSLGYFVLAELTGAPGKILAGSAFGGFVYTNPAVGNMWYTLTVMSVSNWVYPWQETWFGGQIVGRTGSTGTSVIGGPASETYILIPQASYQIWVSETDGSGIFYTYSLPLSGRIETEVIYGISTTGWTPLGPLPSGGTWVAGLPTAWPRPTVTYGTGVFQATLTWVNNASHATDVDLHLYGPNNMHVYYGAKVSADSSFRLDRDWLSAYGNATENIFSMRSTVPAGAYRVAVKHFSGAVTNYSVRIIRSGGVRTYPGTAQNNEEKEILSFNLP